MDARARKKSEAQDQEKNADGEENSYSTSYIRNSLCPRVS